MSVPTPLTSEQDYYRVPVDAGLFEAFIPAGTMAPDDRDAIVSMFGAIKRRLDKRVAEYMAEAKALAEADDAIVK